MNQVRRFHERRNGNAGPRLVGFCCLTALFWISGLIQQFQSAGLPNPQLHLCRHADTPPASLPGGTDSAKSPPLTEEETSVNRTLNNLDDILSVRPSRAGKSLRPRLLDVLPRQMGTALAGARRTFQSEHANPSPRASGRVLRHQLQSQTC